jgi:hypothetical protein
MPLSKITTRSIVDDAIDNTKLDLTDNYAFTGTVTGAGGGITEVDQWRLTADYSPTGDITSSLGRVTTDGAGYIGTGMSQSSGIFTFPSTGIYLIRMKIFSTSNSDTGAIFTTTNNSTYGNAAQSDEANAMCEFLFDVTDTSTHKVKFKHYTGTGSLQGSTAENSTTFTFIRMGDT